LLCPLGPMNQHDDAIAAFQQGRTVEALRLLEELLAENETSLLWNDWAAVQLGAGNLDRAERGFNRAIELDSRNADAITNLGLLLLGRGDSARAVPLLKQALPLLPIEQQKIVKALLADHPAEQSATSGETTSDRRTLRVLVIADSFPNSVAAGHDRRLLELLLGIRTEGDAVTFIARAGANRKQCDPLVRQAGIRTYADDLERLPCLGWKGKAEEAPWSFAEVVSQGQFDIAILIQSFNRSISVPEQYLDDLRQISPAIRIAILVEKLLVAPHSRLNQAPLDFERAEDLANRQWEMFERADAVLVTSAEDAALLQESGRGLYVEVAGRAKSGTENEVTGKAANQVTGTATSKVTDNIASKAAGEGKVSGLFSMLQRIFALAPRVRANDTCSVMQVETLFRERLSTRSGEDRILGQLECYVRLAENLLSEGKAEKAREQLRHIFGRSPRLMKVGYFSSQVLIALKRCYRQLGDFDTAECYASEARRRVVVQDPASGRSRRSQTSGPVFSVIVPTYNRLPILKKCLAALEGQTLPAGDFEVIVIDDGSSDATHEVLSRYRPPFRFQYLRQQNSGTGAARRNGVAHATGEFLLLMNDDTICDADVLEQHLDIQRTYAPERWAVLGSFEYPVAARQRALTQYFCVEPFMFPQVSMEESCPYGYSHFITCNLSVPRDAVVEAGSFDSTYKLSEDTELGIRLFEQGYRIFYHPKAHAIHDHLPYPARNLIRRARVYGADYYYMFGRHPRVMREWTMPVKLTGLDEKNAVRILGYVEEQRQQVEQAVEAVERWDSVDFEPLLLEKPETAAMVLRLFQQAVPSIHWFYLFETMLHTMIRELGLKHMASELPIMQAAHGAGG
jgi:GT2 family glycosyltransferase